MTYSRSKKGLILKKKKKKKKIDIKIKTGVSKRKLNRSSLDYFLTTAFDGSDYELFFMNFKSDNILLIAWPVYFLLAFCKPLGLSCNRCYLLPLVEDLEALTSRDKKTKTTKPPAIFVKWQSQSLIFYVFSIS